MCTCDCGRYVMLVGKLLKPAFGLASYPSKCFRLFLRRSGWIFKALVKPNCLPQKDEARLFSVIADGDQVVEWLTSELVYRLGALP